MVAEEEAELDQVDKQYANQQDWIMIEAVEWEDDTRGLRGDMNNSNDGSAVGSGDKTEMLSSQALGKIVMELLFAFLVTTVTVFS